MIKKYKRIVESPYFAISVVYLLTHGFLLILSGSWWDDWTFISHDINYVNEVAMLSGRPEWKILIPLCWSLKNNGRIAIFLMYYLDSLFIYNILKDSALLSLKDSLLITLLFTVIPVNDARLLISNFPYTVGLFFFILSLMLFIKWNKKSDKSLTERIVILLFFFISFILNSLLAYYYILFIYLLILDLIENKNERLIKRILISTKNVVYKYLDFFIIPFLYLMLNRILFPVMGDEFSSRSSITIIGLLKCVKYLPLSIVNIYKEIYTNMINCLPFIIILAIFITLLLFIKNKEKRKIKIDYCLKGIFLGLIIIVLGLLAYVEIRGKVITTNGVKGRDSILVPLGVSISIYYLYSLLNEKNKKVLYILTIILCVLSFNLLYIEWQKDYYYQLRIQNLLKNNVVKNNDTFFFANMNETKVDGERYYTINANSYNVYKNQTRFFITKVENIELLSNKDEIEKIKSLLSSSQFMKDYNPDDYCFDALLIYNNSLSWYEVIKLKYYELVDFMKFNQSINGTGCLKILEVDDDFTTLLLKEYKEGKIKNDIDVVELLEVYYN